MNCKALAPKPAKQVLCREAVCLGGELLRAQKQCFNGWSPRNVLENASFKPHFRRASWHERISFEIRAPSSKFSRNLCLYSGPKEGPAKFLPSCAGTTQGIHQQHPPNLSVAFLFSVSKSGHKELTCLCRALNFTHGAQSLPCRSSHMCPL